MARFTKLRKAMGKGSYRGPNFFLAPTKHFKKSTLDRRLKGAHREKMIGRMVNKLKKSF